MSANKAEEYVHSLFMLYRGVKAPQHILDHYVSAIVNGTMNPVKVQQEIEFLCGKTAAPPSSSPLANPYTATSPIPPSQLATSFPSVPVPVSVSPTSSSPSLTQPLQPPQPTQFPSPLPPYVYTHDPYQLTSSALLHQQLPSTTGVSTTTTTTAVAPGAVLADGPDKADKAKEYVEQLYMTYVGKVDVGAMRYYVKSLLDGSFTLAQVEFAVKYSKEAKERAKQTQKQMEKEKEEMAKRRLKLEEYVNELFRVYVKQRKPTPEEVEMYVNLSLTGKASLQQLEDTITALGISTALPSVPSTNVPRKK